MIARVRLLSLSCLFLGLMWSAAAGALELGAHERPFLLQFTDDRARVAQIGILGESPIPEGQREIRIWIGFGILRIERMLRLRVGADGEVTGDVINSFRISDLPAEDAQALRADILKGCADWKQGTETETCISQFRWRQNWSRIHRRLIDLGIDRLPDESELPEPEFHVNDGVAMVVEIRDGARYRAYGYSNPGFRTEPEAIAAQKIMQEVSSTMHKTKPVW